MAAHLSANVNTYVQSMYLSLAIDLTVVLSTDV
jgi:hypothetical protein